MSACVYGSRARVGNEGRTKTTALTIREKLFRCFLCIVHLSRLVDLLHSASLGKLRYAKSSDSLMEALFKRKDRPEGFLRRRLPINLERNASLEMSSVGVHGDGRHSLQGNKGFKRQTQKHRCCSVFQRQLNSMRWRDGRNHDHDRLPTWFSCLPVL